MKKAHGRAAVVISAALFWLILWECVSLSVGSELIFPGPVRTLAALIGLLGTSEFYTSVGWTMLRVFGVRGVTIGKPFGPISLMIASAELRAMPTEARAACTTKYWPNEKPWIVGSISIAAKDSRTGTQPLK